MARFQIISKDGKSVRYEGKPKYVGTYLKPSYLEFSEISSPTPINWEVGDYVDYPRTGMRYRLYSIPQASKNARRDSYGGAFTYSNVQLYAATKELEIAPFKDLVLDDNFIHFSTSPDVATFENIIGIADRIQACMDDLYPGRWEIKTVETSSESDLGQMLSTAKDFALSGGTCLDALSKIYELWQEVGWIHSYDSVTGKEVITIGYANARTADNTTDPYLYGKGKGLTAIKKNHTNKDEFATRLYVYGSERNLPTRYYNDKGIANAESVDIRNLMLPLREWGTTNGLPDARKAYLENAEAVAKYGVIPRTHYFDSDDAGADVYPSIEGITIGEVRNYLAVSGDNTYSPDPSIYSNSERVDEIKSAELPKDDGVINKDGKSYDEIGYFAINEKWVSTDISVGESSKTLNACLLASKQFYTKEGKATFRSHEGVGGYLVDNSQISKAILVFELTDSITKNKLYTEEYTLELSEVKDGVREFTLPYSKDMSYTSESGITVYAQIYIKVEFKEPVKSAFFIEYYIKASDCTLEAKRDLPKKFNLTLKQIGFNINERASQGEKKAISMKSGMCEARTFNILDCRYDSENDTWELECARQKDDTLGILFPNTNNPLAEGDRFVLLNIAMPELYVYAAMEKLLVEGEKLLARASKYQCNYEPQIDAKVMQEAEDKANEPESETKPRLLREGMYMEISDEDVIDGETDYVIIDSLNIYEGESAIPTYKVTLREKRKVSYKGTPSATTSTSTSSAEDPTQNIDLSKYATKEYVRNIVDSSISGGNSGGGSGEPIEGLGDLAYKNESDLNLKELAHMDEADLYLGDLAKKDEADLNLKALAHKDSLTYAEIKNKPTSLAGHNYSDSVYYSSSIYSSDYRHIGYSESTIGKGAAIAFGKADMPSVIQLVERSENDNLDIEVRQKKKDASNTTITITDRVVTEKAAENGDIKFDKLHIGDAELSWDSTAKMLKFNKGIYSIGAVSAGEVGTSYTYQFDNWSDWVWDVDASGNKLDTPKNKKLLDYALSARLGVLLNERLTEVEQSIQLGNLVLNFNTIALNIGSNVSNFIVSGAGLTNAAISNILAGKYNKVVGNGVYKDVWDYSAYETSTQICIFLRQGSGVFDFKYNKSTGTWAIADEE
jgi:hypothetical protein